MKLPTIAVGAAMLAAATFAHAGGGIETLTSRQLATGLDHAVFATHAPGDYNRLYVVEKQGRIRVFNLRTGTMNAANFLNIDSIVGGGTTTNDEQGLLGLAFHPDFKTNKTFFVYYTNNNNFPRTKTNYYYKGNEYEGI